VHIVFSICHILCRPNASHAFTRGAKRCLKLSSHRTHAATFYPATPHIYWPLHIYIGHSTFIALFFYVGVSAWSLIADLPIPFPSLFFLKNKYKERGNPGLSRRGVDLGVYKPPFRLIHVRAPRRSVFFLVGKERESPTHTHTLPFSHVWTPRHPCLERDHACPRTSVPTPWDPF